MTAQHYMDGFKGYEKYLQSRMLPQTSLDGGQRGFFTYSFSTYGLINLSHSLCQQAFINLELTLVLLCCIMFLLVITFLLDWMKGFRSFSLNGFQVRTALWCYPQISQLSCTSRFRILPSYPTQKFRCTWNMIYIDSK